MGRNVQKPLSVIVAFRADSEAVEILEWYANYVGVPVGSLLRAAYEDAADAILASYKDDLDPELPDGVLFKRLLYRLNVKDPHAESDSSPCDSGSTV